MQINLSTHSARLQEAFDQVRDPNCDTDWQELCVFMASFGAGSDFFCCRALFGYEAGANFDLNVKATGCTIPSLRI